ncbi:MAG TPA: ABC transporter substrate binding protein [Methylomirabilota bacterium]|nr:ABC transporter substrate binding protein [Methylomirabilota bacterium]
MSFALLLALAVLVTPLVAETQEPGQIARIGMLASAPSDPFVEAFRQGLRELGYVEGRTIDIEYRWTAGKNEQCHLIVSSSPLFYAQRGRLVEFAATQRLPTIYHQSEFVLVSGGFMSYGPDFRDMFRRAATYVDKILKGAKPADLPVAQPTKFELVINTRTAKALGLTIPQSLLLRADKVIE